MAIDLSSVLLLNDNDDPMIPSGEAGEVSGDGIYSITVQSYNGSFVKCFTIRVDRSPNSTYEIPTGYVMISTATGVSTGGVHIVENYVPQMMLDIDTQILLLDSDTNPTKDSASGADFKVLTPNERSSLYSGMNDVYRTFQLLMQVAGVPAINVSSNVTSTRCLKQMSFAFEVTNLQQIDGLLSKRITPATFMQIVYVGFGLVLVQEELNQWSLTDTIAMISSGEPKRVSIENIASLRSSYDYKKMAKSTHITMNGEGQITTSVFNGGDLKEGIDKKNYQSSVMDKATPWASQSLATGTDVELSAPAMPLLRFATYKGVTITAGADGEDAEAEYTLEGDCFPKGVIKAKASEIIEEGEGFMREVPASSKKKYDISALSVVAKGEFARFMHTLLIFRNKLESAQLSTTFEGIVIPAFSSFELTEGAGSLQKVIISAVGSERSVETANVGVTGFVMGSTIIRNSGRIVSVVSYANMEDAFPLVFK